MKLIINADDFGVDYDRDIGIFYCVLRGYVSSVSVIVTNNIGVIRKLLIFIMKKKVSIGLHINLTDDPLLCCKSDELYSNKYTYKKGKYAFWRNSLEKTIDLNVIDKEITTQFEKFVKCFGFIPNHIDGHNHCNIFHMNVNKIFQHISKKYKIHLRIPYEIINESDVRILKKDDYFQNFDINKQHSTIKSILNKYDYYLKYDMLLYNSLCKKFNFKDKIFFLGTIYGYVRDSQFLFNQIYFNNNILLAQLMCHPGFFFPFFSHKSKFSNFDRLKELKSLKQLKKMIKDNNINIVSYKEINIM